MLHKFPPLKKVEPNPHFFCNFIIFILEGFAPLFLKVDLAPPFPKVDKGE